MNLILNSLQWLLQISYPCIAKKLVAAIHSQNFSIGPNFAAGQAFGIDRYALRLASGQVGAHFDLRIHASRGFRKIAIRVFSNGLA